MAQNILLDPSIRNWVLLPLIAILLFVNILRHYAALLMASATKPNMSRICKTNVVNYARLLLGSGGSLPRASFAARAKAMIDGDLKQEVDPPNPMDMISDPAFMTNMLKNQFMTMVPNIGMMMLISYFFSGFVVAQFPFPLSPRFRGMVQRGLDIDDLDGNYVTSLSLFFIVMAGSQGLLSLLLGQNVDDMNEQAIMMQQMASGAAAAAPENYQVIFKQLSSELAFSAERHRCTYDDAPELLLKEWKATRKQQQQQQQSQSQQQQQQRA